MKKILIGLLVVIILLIVAGFFFPRHIEITRSMTIHAPAMNAFEEVNNLEKWDRWSYWNNLYKDDMKVVYGDVRSGVGGNYSWDGEESGKGKVTITESVPYSTIKADLDFMEQGTAKAWYLFDEKGDSTEVTMGFGSDMGANPLMRWVGALLLKPEMTKAFDYNLAKLKELAEAKPRYSVEITEETMEPVTYVGILTTMSPKDLIAVSAQMAKSYGELAGVLAKAKVPLTGHPFSIYPKYSDTSMDMVCALPVPATAKLPAKYKVTQTGGGKVVKAVHKGDYYKLQATHDALNKYITDNKLEYNGPAGEIYVTDPGVVKDTAQWITEVYYPVK